MRALITALLASAALSTVPAPRAAAEPEAVPEPPPSRREDLRERLHGVEVADPYRWLEDQESAETRAWIRAQREYTDSLLANRPERSRITARLGELLKTDSRGTPSVRNGTYFFSRRKADQDLSVLCYRKSGETEDRVLLDPHSLSPDGSINAGYSALSRDGKLAAYWIREGGKDEVTLKFREVATGRDLPDVLPRARYMGAAFAADRSGVYYSIHDPEQGPRVRFHRFGTEVSGDSELFGKGYGPEKIIGIDLSDDYRYLLITVFHGSAAEKTELYYVDTRKGTTIVPVVNDVNARFSGAFGGDTLFVETNWNAPKGRILRVDPGRPAIRDWKEIIPEGKFTLESFSTAGGRLCVRYLEDVRSRVTLFTPEGKKVRDIRFPTIGTVGGIAGRWDQDEAFFIFTSFHVPTTIYRYRIGSDRREVWHQPQVPVRSDELHVEQVFYRSKDGTRIPMFLLHRKGLKRDGNRPVYLTGYGGFTSVSRPAFSATAAFWAENDGVYALPGLRGGGEYGEEWHRAGMLEKKQNVFDDFIAAAEWLIENRYTRPERLAIAGGSNGGLLVGAAMTQRPELFRAVICSVPLLDMVRYHRFLVARFWVPEYGSSEDPEQFRYLYAYSPYHRVKPGTRYPAVLFSTGDADTRVAPLHARKMAALLQAATGAKERPVLLQYDEKAGHSGGKPLGKAIDDLSLQLAFLCWQLGIEPR